MKLPFGKYKGIDTAFVNSGYLKWLMRQDWFIEQDSPLTVAVEQELAWRDKWDEHFYRDKIKVKEMEHEC